MPNENIKAAVYASIEAIANAEKITRAEMKTLSRELLLYVPDSQDIGAVNKLLSVLTPMNKRMSILFFSHFLPWEAERDNDGEFIRFGKRTKSPKQDARKLALIKEFLADDNNNIWTWAEANVEVEQKEVNMFTVFSDALKQALSGVDTKTKHAKPLTKQQIVDIVVGEITFDDMVEAMAVAEQRVADIVGQAQPEKEAA